MNFGPGAVDVVTWGYGIQHSPTTLGSVSPGLREEFTLADSVYVSTPPSTAGRSGGSTKVEYLCRPFTADFRY